MIDIEADAINIILEAIYDIISSEDEIADKAA